MIAMTIIIPKPIPALKILVIASQEVNTDKSNSIATMLKRFNFFIVQLF